MPANRSAVHPSRSLAAARPGPALAAAAFAAVLASIVGSTAGCSGSSSGNRMKVVATFPANKAANVAPGTQIWARFSTLVDIDTVDTGSFNVTGSMSGAVGGTFVLEGDDRKVVFTPAAAFQNGETVTVKIDSDIKGQSGVSSRSKKFTFTIDPGAAPPPAPQIVSRQPEPNATGVPRDAEILVTFDVAMDPFSFTSATVVVRGDLSGIVSSQIGGIMDTGKTLRLVPSREFLAGERITVSIGIQVGSAEGGRFGGDAFSFVAASDAPPEDLVRGADVPVAGKVIDLRAADLDSDGILDLVTRVDGAASIVVLRGAGGGAFEPIAPLTAAETILSMAIVDLDGDGRLDILAGALDRVAIFGNTTDDLSGLTFAAAVDFATGAQVHSIAAGDIDHRLPKLPDLVLDTADGLRVHREGLASAPNVTLGDARLSRTAILLGDIEADGRVDLIYGDAAGNKLTLRRFAADGGFGASMDRALLGDALAVLVEELTGDTIPETIALVANPGGGELIQIHAASGAMDSPPGTPMAVASLATSNLALGDLDGDGWIDILVGNPESATLHWVRNDAGSFDLAGDALRILDAAPVHAAIAVDVTGDGVLDVIAASDDRLIPLLSEDAAPPLNALGVADVSARPGDEGVAVDVILSNESPVEGYTVVVGFDAAALEATSISIAGTATGALAPEFTAPVIDSNAGFLSFSAIFDFMPPFENKLLAPGADQILFRPIFRVRPEATPGAKPISFPESAGAAPPQRTVLTSGGMPVPHTGVDGAFTVLDPLPPPPNLVSIVSTEGEIGAANVPVEVRLDNEDAIEALTLAIAFESQALSATRIELEDTVLGAAAPEFSNAEIDNPAGTIVYAAILDMMPPFDGRQIAPGAGQKLLEIIFDVAFAAPEGEHAIRFPADIGGRATQLVGALGATLDAGTRDGVFTVVPDLTPDNFFGFGAVEAKQSDKGVPVHLLLSNDTPIDAFTIFVGFDVAALAPVSVSLAGSATEASAPEFTNVRMPFGEPFVGLDVIFDFRSPFDGNRLPPGRQQILFKPIFDVLQTAPLGDRPLEVLTAAGSDESRLIFEGARVPFTSVDGVFKVLQGPPPPDNPNKLVLRDITVPPGVVDFPTTVLLTTVEKIDAITVVGVYDKANLQVVDFNIVGTALEPLEPELVVSKIEDELDPPFFAYSAIFDVFPPFTDKKIQPGQNKPLLHLIFDVPAATPEGVYDLLLRNELGKPPLSNSIVVSDTVKGARTVFPSISGGKVTVKETINPVFIRADTNGSGNVDLADHIYLVNYVYRGGPKPPCFDAADVDDSGAIEFLDMVLILDYLFKATFVPPAPFPDPGADPSADSLGCEVGLPVAP